MDESALAELLRNERYPRAAGYSARWVVEGGMGPHPLWQAEALSECLVLEPGMRVLDMGCGSALSSVFLAKEFGVEVWAVDLWVKPEENFRRVVEAELEGRVHPLSAEAHALPFTEGFFDAAVSIGAYHYFGTDDLYLGYYSRFVKHGGQIGIIQPGLAEEYETLPPPHLTSYWKWDFCAWHSAAWWRRHWEKTGLVTVEVAERLPEGWRDWLQWNEACDLYVGMPGQEEARMLHADGGRTLGLCRVVARRNGKVV
ncbi:methyltransferase domain-containing protein [Kribbella antibiotica]|uniref:Methyltransferase domain-containing protein n=1 Tax=Kribbella antibiotica TaxID=190195 RepID=A0A4R4YNV8_9ACTN|nr:methyltransferase domain-containing protein [Kribbella antibiotica]TDD46756.1 methyltransferase domain-containing protein [Kribbella antibiotica]